MLLADPEIRGGREIDSNDLCTRGETRYELSNRNMLSPVDEVVGNSFLDPLEGQLTPLDLAIQPDDVNISNTTTRTSTGRPAAIPGPWR